MEAAKLGIHYGRGCVSCPKQAARHQECMQLSQICTFQPILPALLLGGGRTRLGTALRWLQEKNALPPSLSLEMTSFEATFGLISKRPDSPAGLQQQMPDPRVTAPPPHNPLFFVPVKWHSVPHGASCACHRDQMPLPPLGIHGRSFAAPMQP